MTCDVMLCEREAVAKVTLKSPNVAKVKWDVCGRHLAKVSQVLLDTEDK